jgi:hypothetical protein
MPRRPDSRAFNARACSRYFSESLQYERYMCLNDLSFGTTRYCYR